MQRANAILTTSWIVSLMGDSPANPKPTILTFELDNPDPVSLLTSAIGSERPARLHLAILPEQALEIARAIINQYENPPPPPNRYS
ncbi:hypothetical protein ACVIW2_008110 [Bradyrhizobium huanghuaihaiense]